MRSPRSVTRGLAMLLGIAASGLVACAEPLTEIVVVVDSDLPVPAGLDAVRVTVEGPSGIPVETSATLTGAGTARLPVTLGVRPRETGSGTVRVRAVGARAGTERVAALARTNFVEGERLLLRMVLEAACVDVRCAADETCSGGACVDARRDPATLPRFDGSLDLGVDLGAASDAGGDGPVVCPDADDDGHTSALCGGDDCDDADPARNPDEAEVCNGGIDDDCDGRADADDGVCVPCGAGFTGPGDGDCTDVNECAVVSACGAAALDCMNLPGSFTCTCAPGYSAAAGSACADVDECAAPIHPCGVGRCENGEGSYNCFCPLGYERTTVPSLTCIDVDECADALADCDTRPAATCGNVEGGFTCTCPAGYAGDGRGASGCVDVDECAAGIDDCDDAPAAACVNDLGTFTCTCPTGYVGSGRGAGGCLLDDPSLSNLEFGAGAIPSIAFTPARLSYGLSVPYGATTTTIAPSVADPARATITVDGVIVASGTAVTVGVGTDFAARSVIIRVTTESGTTRVYNVSIVRSGLYVKASNTGAGDLFGSAVALSRDGTTLVVGAPYEDSSATGIGGDQTLNGATDAGVVYVFRRAASGAWTQEAYIKASNARAFDYFGFCLGLSDDGATLAVAARGEDSAATGINGDQSSAAANDAGAVYVFRRGGTGTWVQEAYVKASNTGTTDSFAFSLALSGDGATLAVGAPFEDSGATGIGGSQSLNTTMDAGAAYVFRRSGLGVWSQEAYVKASNTGAADRFGWSVALASDGATLAIGANYEDSNAVNVGGDGANNSVAQAGAAYVFARSVGGVWSQSAYVKSSSPDMNDEFGFDVSLSGDGATLAVSAPYEASASTGVGGDPTSNAAPLAGAVFLFRRTLGGPWAPLAYLKASNTDVGDFFGSAITLSGDGTALLVGAHSEDSSARRVAGDSASDASLDAGAAYLFRQSPGGAWAQEAYVKASNTGPGDRFGENQVALSADARTIAVGAAYEDSAATGIAGDATSEAAMDSGAVYVF
jgi:hypothetical protein